MLGGEELMSVFRSELSILGRIVMYDNTFYFTCLFCPHARQLVKLHRPLLAALVHLHPPGLHLGVELVLLLVQSHLVSVGLAGLQTGTDTGGALPPGLAVLQHLGGLLQAVGGAVASLALRLSSVYPGSKTSEQENKVKRDIYLAEEDIYNMECQIKFLMLDS